MKVKLSYVAISQALLLLSTNSMADCTTTGVQTLCASPTPRTTTVGTGNQAAEDNRSVDVQTNAQINVGNANAISLRDYAQVHVADGALVSNQSNSSSGLYSTGGNTIEFRSNGTLTVDVGGTVAARGTQANAEAVNLQGADNIVINRGTISAASSAAIWFQNTSGKNTIVNEASGVIQAGDAALAPKDVIGSSGNGAVDFSNKGKVIGNLNFAGGDDVLRFYTGSTLTGSFNGGAGNDTIYLSGDGNAALPGDMTNFESLIKNDTGTWTLTGTIAGVTVANVQQGTLALTGNNGNYTGKVIVDGAGTLQARAQSLPPSVINNGLVRFTQPDAGNYAGLISGTGVVEKTGAGVLTLAPATAGGNTYSGGTRINEGTIAIGADNALGAATGSLSFNGGTLQLNGNVDLANTRAVTVNAPGGTIDTQGFASTLTQGITGAGALTKAGSGTLTLTGASSYAGGTTVAAGTLQLGNGGSSGSLVGDVVNNGVLAFKRADVASFTGVVSGSGALSQLGSGSTILTGNSTYSGGTTITAGTLQLGNGGSSGSIIGDVANNGALVFKRADATSFAGVVSGTGSLTQAGSGSTTLTANSTYSGGTAVAAGALIVGDDAHRQAALSGGGPVQVDAGATLGGYGSLSGNTVNNGTIAVADALAQAGSSSGSLTFNGELLNAGLARLGGNGVGNSLIVAGNYVGQNGTLAINTRLGSDGSPSDKLVIRNGLGSGSSLIRITNVGGAGAVTTGNGIQVVDASAGGTTTASAFKLAGPAVAGPYEYTLHRGGGDAAAADSWFLRNTLEEPVTTTPTTPSTPDYRQEVSLYTAVPPALLLYGRTLLDTLHERVGDETQLRGQPTGDTTVNGAWGRVIGASGNVDGGDRGIYDQGPGFDYQIIGAQTGLDLYRAERADASRDHVGIYVARGRIKQDVEHVNHSDAGHNATYANTFGAYWTHFGSKDWYIDGVVQATWYDVTASSGRIAALNTDGFGMAGSLETGYPLQVGGSWIVEPQAQLMYQKISLDTASDGAATVRFDDAHSLLGRIGARVANTQALTADAAARRLVTAWLRANIWHEFAGEARTEFSSADGFIPFQADVGDTWGELSAGITTQLSNTVSLYLSAGYQASFDGRAYSYDGKAGLRVNW